MGGGGVMAMRAAAKIAGRRAFSAENPVVSAAAARTATRPASAAISTSDETKSSVFAVVSQNDGVDAGMQRPCWELDDLEFAGVEEEMIVQPREPMRRLVFGGPPTLQEVKDATSVLKKVYLSSPNSTGCGDSYMSDNESTLSLLSETKACVTSETTVASVPKNALQVVRLLQESSTAQNVVASIAGDPNVWHAVWHAVLKNKALMECLESQKSIAPFSDLDLVVKASAAKTAFLEHLSQENVAGSYDSEQSADSGNGVRDFLQSIKARVVDMVSADSGNGVRDFLQSIKARVVDMVTSLSDYFQSIFRGPTAGKASTDTDGSAGAIFVDKFVGASLMGLVVMVIMMVVLKRV